MMPAPIRPDLPPHDTAAEEGVVAALLALESSDAVRRTLSPSDFYGDSTRTIYEAIVDIEDDQRTPTIVAIVGALQDAGKLQRVGGSKYIAEMTLAPTTIDHLPELVERVIEKARLRRIVTVAKRIVSEGQIATDAAALLAGAQRALNGIEVVRCPLEVVTSADIFAPLDPVPWVVRDLYLAPGRPALVVGYGYSAKSVSCQALLAAIAADVPVWGQYRITRPGRVLHIDHEQGLRATRWRYQRICRAMGVTEEMIGDRLTLASLPRSFRLSNPDAEDILLRATEGHATCLIDSLKASTPGLDENDSAIRESLDVCLRVSEKTGVAFVVIHHAGKGGKDKDARERGRGSSAIFDACGLVLQLDGGVQPDGSTLVKVEMSKAPADASGAALRPFYLRVGDVVSETGQERWGLSCEHQTSEQVSPPQSPDDIMDGVCADVLAIVAGEQARNRAVGDVTGVSGNFVRGLYRGKSAKLITPALERLERAGKLVRSDRKGRGGGHLWSLPEPSEQGDDA